MDRDLLEILANRKLAPGESAGAMPDFDVTDLEKGEIVLRFADGKQPYHLKSIRELLKAESPGGDRVHDIEDDHYVHLVMGVETMLLDFCEENPDVTAGAVRRAMTRLAKDPCDEGSGEFIFSCLRFELRMILSTEDYSGSEVAAVLRKLVRSSKMHTDMNGPLGYHKFLDWFYAQGGATDEPPPLSIDLSQPAQRPKKSKSKAKASGKVIKLFG